MAYSLHRTGKMLTNHHVQTSRGLRVADLYRLGKRAEELHATDPRCCRPKCETVGLVAVFNSATAVSDRLNDCPARRSITLRGLAMLRSRGVLLGAICLLFAVPSALADSQSPRETARRVDELLAAELFGAAEGAKRELAPPADDETFLRRAALDLVGCPPTTEEITSFVLDQSSDKRSAAVARLLADKRFGDNWARYWRDVIFYRRSEDRAGRRARAREVFDRRVQRRTALERDRPEVLYRHRRYSRGRNDGADHGPERQRRGYDR